MIETFFWLLVVAGGPLLLGVALFIGMAKRRRLTRSEENKRSEAIDALYHKE